MSVTSRHLRRNRARLGITYGAVVVENVFELLYPFAIGLAIDGLLDDDWAGTILLVSIALAHLAVSIARQIFDTRSFNRLYSDIASELVEQQRADGVATSAVAARAALAGEYVEFLEEDVGAAIAAAFAVFGSLLMLLLYDPTLGVVSATLGIPVIVLNILLMKRSRRVYRLINDQTEIEVSLIDRADSTEVRHHFRSLAGHWNRLSDSEAMTWGVVDLFAVGLIVFALVRATDLDGDVGAIFAIVAYVWSYTAGFDAVPTVIQRLSNLSDIRRRVDEVADVDRSSGDRQPDS